VGELTKLFTNADAGNAANNGFAVRFKSFATQMLSLSGSLQTRSEGLKTRIRSNEDRQAALEDRVLMTEKRLRAQYTALDNAMAQLTGKQSYVTQMLDAISRASSSSD
jgi:flagellar hook-associated protein 2